jgi:xylulokinase
MISSFIGSGAWNRNEMMISYGTYGCAPILLNDVREVVSEKSLRYPIEWAASIPRSGQQLAALAQVLLPSRTQQEALSRLDSLAATSIPGANGVVFLQTLDLATSIESTEPRASIFNVGKNNTIADICRSMLESFGYGLKYCFENSATAVSPTKCFAASGGARSKTWRQIVSDITGLQQYYFPYSSSAYGVAVLAAVSMSPETWKYVHELLSSNLEIVHPNPECHAKYTTMYEMYKRYLARFGDGQT